MLPELAVPLATHTGWNLRHPDIGGAEQLLVFAGATIPFARTRAERQASGDPRPSIEERYASRADYLERVRTEAPRAGAQPATSWRTTSSCRWPPRARLWDRFVPLRAAR